MKALIIIARILIILLVIYLIILLVYYVIESTSKRPEGKNTEEAKQGYFQRISTGEIFYREAGLGKRMILLHGFGSSSASYQGLMEALDDTYRVFALDFVGFGLSSKEKDNDLSFEGQVKTVIEFMDKKGINKAHLVGHSMGGAVAVKLAATYPDRFEKVVLISPAGWGEYQGELSYIKYFPHPIDKFIVRGFLQTTGAIKTALNKAFYEDELVTKEIVMSHWEPTQTRRADWSYAKKIKMGIVPDIKDEFSKISQPTLVIWGREDEILSSETLRAITEQVDKSEGYFIENSGHVPHQENPESLASLIKRFLARII